MSKEFLIKRYNDFLEKYPNSLISTTEAQKIDKEFEDNCYKTLGLPVMDVDIGKKISSNKDIQIRLAKGLLDAEKIKMDWDEIHKIPNPEVYLSPVFVSHAYDDTGGLIGYQSFCNGRVRFSTPMQYKGFLWGGPYAEMLFMFKPDLLIDAMHGQRNRIPETSVDVVLQSILMANGNNVVYSNESKKKMKEMLVAKNPGYRLAALKGLKQFITTKEEIAEAIYNALKEENQAFAYFAFQNLQYLDASEAQKIALQYLKNCDTESDGTACDVNENFKEFLIKSLPSNVSDISKLLIQIKK